MQKSRAFLLRRHSLQSARLECVCVGVAAQRLHVDAAAPALAGNDSVALGGEQPFERPALILELRKQNLAHGVLQSHVVNQAS